MGTGKKTISSRKPFKIINDTDDDRSTIPSPTMSRTSNDEDMEQPISHIEIPTTSAQPIMSNQTKQQQPTTTNGDFQMSSYQIPPNFNPVVSQYQQTYNSWCQLLFSILQDHYQLPPPSSLSNLDFFTYQSSLPPVTEINDANVKYRGIQSSLCHHFSSQQIIYSNMMSFKFLFYCYYFYFIILFLCFLFSSLHRIFFFSHY